MKVNCIVVTYNRQSLLQECLTSILSQSYPIDRIIVINNNSSDNTLQYLQSFSKDERFCIVNLGSNIGGAGGFNIGLKKSLNIGCDWTWLMDDDTIPTQNALENLICKIDLTNNLGFLSSKVLWTNGDVHLMNITAPTQFVNKIPFNQYSSYNLFLIPSGSFVSMIIRNEVVRKVGLPIKEFFIWGDDVEYSQRIIENGYLGGYVNDSIVYHKTKDNYGASLCSAPINMKWKFFYGTRNSIFLVKKSFSGFKAAIKIVKLIFENFHAICKRKEGKIQFFQIVLKGSIIGLFFSPKIEFFSAEESSRK